MKRVVAILLGATLAATAAIGEAALSVEALVAAGTAGNLDLQKARRALVDAEKGLKWQSELADTRVSLSGDYTSPDKLSGRAQVSVPIIPQVSVAAGVDSKGGRVDASVSLSPFAAWRTSYEQKAAYRKAQVELDYNTAKLDYDIESAAYGVTLAQANVTIAQARLALQVERTDISQKTYELGELSYDDLQTARSDLISARQSEFDAERSLLNARVKLYRLLGPAAGEPAVAVVTLEELLALIASRDEILAKKSASGSSSLTLRQAEIDLDSLREQLAATPTYRPNLGLSAGLSYSSSPTPGDPAVSGSGGVSFGFSPSDIKTEDRATIRQSIADAERQMELEHMALRLEASILVQALAVARQVLETGQAELKQAELTFAESGLLLEQGQRTSLEVEQARLDVESARARLLQAASGILDAQAQMLLSYSL